MEVSVRLSKVARRSESIRCHLLTHEPVHSPVTSVFESDSSYPSSSTWSSLSSRRSYLNRWAEVESECEKVKLPVEVEHLVTFIKVGVGNWSRDLDTCSLVTCTSEYSHHFRCPRSLLTATLCILTLVALCLNKPQDPTHISDKLTNVNDFWRVLAPFLTMCYRFLI